MSMDMVLAWVIGGSPLESVTSQVYLPWEASHQQKIFIQTLLHLTVFSIKGNGL